MNTNNKTTVFDPQLEITSLRNEIEYLKGRVAELERVNLFKAPSYRSLFNTFNNPYVQGNKDE